MVAYIIINLRDSGFSQWKGKVEGERHSKTISKKSTQKKGEGKCFMAIKT